MPARAGRRDPAHVAQVTPHYPPALGGVEVVVAALARELARDGVSVDVLTTSAGAGDAPAVESEGGVRVRRHRAVRLAHTPLAPGLVGSLLRQPRGTLVHVHVAHALVLELVRLTCLLKRSRYVAHLHLDVDASGPAGRLLPLYKRWLLGPALRGAARVVVLSPEMGAFVREAYAVPADRVAVVRNGVDDRFFAGATQDTATDPTRPLRVLSVGRLSAQKNLPRLLRALTRTTAPVEVTVAGDGEDRAAIEALAAELGLDGVRFVGAQRPDDVVRLMREADALVLASDKEGMPLVVLEAMAVGLPVLATDVPGTRELVDGVGLLVPATDAGLAEGLSRLATDRTLLTDLARRGRERAADHTWSDVAAQVHEEYERAWSTS